MGQKVHPVGIRLGVIKNHNSVWYADKNDYSEYLKDDLEVRAYLKKLYEASGIKNRNSSSSSSSKGHRPLCAPRNSDWKKGRTSKNYAFVCLR